MEAARTRIVCTIGPSSNTPTILSRMMKAGMDGARLNFSHGTHDEHRVLIRNIRSAARKTGSTVAIIQDLQGPKIRVGVLPDGGILLHDGQKITFSTASSEYESGGPIPVTYRRLHNDVKAGERILLDDGSIETHVTRV
ncbi:MAG: pyruvate kinase, partial [Candidatus Uhrbacteria bacterium]|nr:pyruvate kinase [Candidatus Uhrbacteria bacterium]